METEALFSNSSGSFLNASVVAMLGIVADVGRVAPGTSSDSGATASRTPRRASKRERARESMLSWTAVMGSIL